MGFPKKIAALISKGGTTNLEVWNAQKAGGVLHGLVKTIVLISSNPGAAGITKAIKAGFPRKHIQTVDPAEGLENQLLEILSIYKPDAFHQMGWEPWTPDGVRESYLGFNQHVGPGGKFMYYQRRILAQQLFCKKIGQKRPIPIFIQYVGKGYDEGDAIYVVYYDDFELDEKPEEIGSRILPIEHHVQIKGLKLWATGEARPFPVPRVYETEEEKLLMNEARIAARDRYPRLMKF